MQPNLSKLKGVNVVQSALQTASSQTDRVHTARWLPRLEQASLMVSTIADLICRY